MTLGQFNVTKPALLFLGPRRFAMMQELHFLRANGDFCRIPLLLRNGVALGLTTDGKSTPWILEPIAGDEWDECAASVLLHDGLYRLRFVVTRGHVRPIDQHEADTILDEGLEALGVDRAKRSAIAAGLRIGGWTKWNSRGPVDLAAVTLANPGPDFAPLHVLAVPSFNPEVSELAARRLTYTI